MENFEQKNHQIENVEKQEHIVFVGKIRKFIVNTFPFTSEDEKNTFSDKFESIIENCGDLTDAELVKNIRLIIASLENTHTNLEEKEKMEFYLEKPIFYRANKFWIEDNGVILEVTSMDGIAIDDLIQDKMKECGGGTVDYKITTALRGLVSSKTSRSVVVGIKRENENSDLNVDFVGINKFPVPVTSKSFINGKMLDQQIGYLQIKSWSNHANFSGKNVADLVEEELEPLMASDFLIIDVRENGGGDSSLAKKLAGRFVKKATHYGTVLKRQARKDELVNSELELEPQGDFFDKKVVVLARCLL